MPEAMPQTLGRISSIGAKAQTLDEAAPPQPALGGRNWNRSLKLLRGRALGLSGLWSADGNDFLPLT